MDFWIAVGLIAIALAVLVIRPTAQIARLEGHLGSIDNNLLELNARMLNLESQQHGHGDRISSIEVFLPVPREVGAALREVASQKGLPPEYLAMYAVDARLARARRSKNPEDPFPEFPSDLASNE